MISKRIIEHSNNKEVIGRLYGTPAVNTRNNRQITYYSHWLDPVSAFNVGGTRTPYMGINAHSYSGF